MKVIELINGFGIDNLHVVERTEPRLGFGVRIKMKAWSLNYRDLMLVKGLYNPKLKFPCVPLSDGVGTVAAVGEGVSRVKVGDRVAGCFMQGWIAGELTDAKSRTALGGGQAARGNSRTNVAPAPVSERTSRRPPIRRTSSREM